MSTNPNRDRENMTESGLIRDSFEHAPQALAVYGLDGNILFANQACAGLFEGNELGTAGGLENSFPYVLCAADRERLLKQGTLRLEFIARAERPHDSPSANRTQPTGVRHSVIMANVNCARKESGEPQSYVAAFHDITQAQQEEEDRRLLLLAADLGEKVVVLTNAEGAIEYVNTPFLRSSGYTAGEVLGKNPRVLKSGLMTEEVYKRMWTTLHRGEMWQGELLNRKKSGELYWEQVIISPVFTKGTHGMRYLAVKENITERKLLRGRLDMLQGVMRVMATEHLMEKAAPKLGRIIAESLAAGWVELWLQDPDTEDLLCMVSHELAGTLKRPTEAPVTGARLLRGTDQRFKVLTSLGHLRLNMGEPRNVLAFPIRTDQGGSGVLVVGDMVSSPNVIPAIELVCAQLGHFVQRSRMETEILHARDVAEAANRAKSAFLSNMSHELCTPLNAILGLAQMLARERGLNPSQLRNVETIERSGLELLALINAILDISRVVSSAQAEGEVPEILADSLGRLGAVRRLLDSDTAPRKDSAPAYAQAAEAHPSLPRQLGAYPILDQIHLAAKRADIDQLNRLIDELARQDASLAVRLRERAELFDYEAITTMTESSPPQGREEKP